MPLKIASRTSPLALWQSEQVQQLLAQQSISSVIFPIESTGDLQLSQPLYALGISGVFTKELDLALLQQRADLAVHSLKDVPTTLAQGLILASVLERAAVHDVLLFKQKEKVLSSTSVATIATSSLRRAAQWKQKYPHHQIVSIRGNVQTRLKKFNENEQIDGVIFAQAGLERMKLLPIEHVVLDWMIPAPAQGTIGIVCNAGDAKTIAICKQINHQQTWILSCIERNFLNTLQGGCSVPIAALATTENTHIDFIATIHDFDGREAYQIQRKISYDLIEGAGKNIATEFLQQSGVMQLLQKIKSQKQ